MKGGNVKLDLIFYEACSHRRHYSRLNIYDLCVWRLRVSPAVCPLKRASQNQVSQIQCLHFGGCRLCSEQNLRRLCMPTI